MATTKDKGEEGEARALRHLTRQGLELIQRNYRVAKGPHAPGGEIDLIMRDRAGTVVFVEVRTRRQSGFGGAAASITVSKQRRLVWTAQHYLRIYRSLPPCRFDVVICEGSALEWIQGAFDASCHAA